MEKIFRLNNCFLFSALLVLFSSRNVFGQSEDNLKDLKKAEQSYVIGDYGEALKLYLPLLSTMDETSIVQNSINYKVGFCYYASAPEDSFAVPYFRKYLETSDVHFEAYYFLGNIASSNHQFDSAVVHFTKFKQAVELNTELSNSGLSEQIVEIADRQISKCEFGKFLVKYPGCAKVESATGGVNTEYSEYAPVISPDETKLVFTRRSPQSLGGRISEDGDFFEDIFISQMNKISVPAQTDSFGNAIGEKTVEALTFTLPVNMGGVNTEGHEGAIQFSSDGTKIYIYRKSNIWVSALDKTGKWTKAKKQKQIKGVLRPKTFEPSVSISPEGNVIYFSSERPGGMGGLDIYKAERASNGVWSAPVNLGETINTSYDEDAPFISADGKTLYFSSKGHTNMGDYDIFITEFNGESWSNPMNMGYPVNSAGDDIFYNVSTQSGLGFFSSNRFGGSGLMDIYKASFPANTKTNAEIAGIVFSNDSTPAYVNLVISDIDKPGDSIVIFNDSLTGAFSLPAIFGKNYSISINEKNYEPRKDTVKIPELVYFCQQFKDSIKNFINKLKKDSVSPADSLAMAATSDSIAYADSIYKAKADSSAKAVSGLKSNLEKVIDSEKKDKGALVDPAGVILFRVQIGAFKTPPSKNTFSEVANLQVVPFEDGLTRYFSGAFSTYNEASQRKTEMQTDGYEGAFIVAFKNGQRIPMAEAIKKK